MQLFAPASSIGPYGGHYSLDIIMFLLLLLLLYVVVVVAAAV